MSRTDVLTCLGKCYHNNRYDAYLYTPSSLWREKNAGTVRNDALRVLALFLIILVSCDAWLM